MLVPQASASVLSALVFTAMLVMLLAEALDAYHRRYARPNCAPPMTTRISTVCGGWSREKLARMDAKIVAAMQRTVLVMRPQATLPRGGDARRSCGDRLHAGHIGETYSLDRAEPPMQ
jgi:hypothetical protein